MTPVHPPAKVLVSGATGFIGAWVVRTFLERGYDVRGAVRSNAKGEWLAQQEWAKAAPGKFEYAIVKDIETVGAFDEAVKDISVIAHTASPVVFSADSEPSEIIDPAVNGTLGILKSALKYGSAVKRVVITSSIAAIVEPTTVIRVFTEEDWNNVSMNEIESKGAKASAMDKYRASKAVAEKTLWKFAEEHKGKINFEVSTILPTFVYGPIIHEVPSLDKLNVSIKTFYDCVRKEVPLESMAGFGNFVDVRDVAFMHAEAVERDEAAGQRFLAGGGTHAWQDVYDALNAHADPIAGVPVGTPGAGKSVVRLSRYSTEKAKALLGMKFRSLSEVSYDTLTSLKERGFWP